VCPTEVFFFFRKKTEEKSAKMNKHVAAVYATSNVQVQHHNVTPQ
jgi:hypothetical protein